MAAEMKRQQPGEVHQNKGWTIEKFSSLKYAPSSGGSYFFSEKGVGVHPLVIVGTENEISNWLISNSHKRIINQFDKKKSSHEKKYGEMNDDLSYIWMGISRYTPGKRFRAISPVAKAVELLTDNITGLLTAGIGNISPAPFTHLNLEVAGGGKDLIGALQTLLGVKLSWKELSAPFRKGEASKWCIKFSYMEEPGLTKFSYREVNFSTVRIFLSKLYKFGY